MISCISALLLTLAACGANAATKKFYIGGLFPTDLSGPQEQATLGLYPMLAAEFAALRVEESGLLASHNVILEVVSFETSCRRDEAVYAYLQLMEALKMRKSETGDNLFI